MSNEANDWPVTFAIYATALVAVLASLVRQMGDKDWGSVPPTALLTLTLYVLWGGAV